MNENNAKQSTSLSNAGSIEEAGNFWDSHSLADYWDQTREVEIEVMARRRRRVTIDPDLYSKIAAQARLRGVLPETLVNTWLTERLEKISKS